MKYIGQVFSRGQSYNKDFQDCQLFFLGSMYAWPQEIVSITEKELSGTNLSELSTQYSH